MCTYLHSVKSTYYFRRPVPAKLRGIVGKREFYFSLGVKDRDEAKRLIPHHTIATDKILASAREVLATKPAPAAAPASSVSREEWEFREEQAELASDYYGELDEQADRLADFLDSHPMGEQIKADQRAEIALVRMEEKARASVVKIQAVEQSGNAKPKGKGMYLDTDIINGWARERKPKARTQDAYWRDAQLFNKMVGRKSVELLTKADVMAFKRKLIDDPKRSQTNVRDKLASVRTLLGWAAGEDIIADNPAQDVRMTVTERKEKRQDFNIDDLNALFSSPVYSKGARPKGYAGGEAAYWLPLIALFMGARREEIGQLRVSDVKRVPYVDEAEKRQEAWCLDITEFSDGEDDDLANSVKTDAGNRLVPIHPTLIQLGFVDYVNALPDQKGRAFPDLKAVGDSDRLTNKWGQWFGDYKRACGITAKTKVFHSFRHTWKTLANDAKIADRVQRAFQGHEGKDTADKYGAAPAMRIMVEAIASFRVPGLILPGKPHTDTP